MPDLFISPDDAFHSSGPPAVPEKEPAGQNHGLFSTFCLYPDDIDFETREDDEKIILMLRKHIVTNIRWIVVAVALLLVPTLAKIFGVFNSLPVGYGLIISLSWYLVTAAYALENFLDWYFDVYFVTNMRIVDVEFTNLINKHVSGAIVDKVQDVTYTTSGVFRTIFDFGDVFIQTAAEVPEFDFFAVPSPGRVAKVIDDLKLKTKQKNGNI